MNNKIRFHEPPNKKKMKGAKQPFGHPFYRNPSNTPFFFKNKDKKAKLDFRVRFRTGQLAPKRLARLINKNMARSFLLKVKLNVKLKFSFLAWQPPYTSHPCDECVREASKKQRKSETNKKS